MDLHGTTNLSSFPNVPSDMLNACAPILMSHNFPSPTKSNASMTNVTSMSWLTYPNAYHSNIKTPADFNNTEILFEVHNNYGKSEHSSHRIPTVRNIIILFYTLFTMCGATFNLILIFALVKYYKQTLTQNITNLFVLCLAVSDIFLCSVSIPIQVFYEINENHQASKSLCRVLFSSFGIPMYISCLTILLIAFDRYRLIVYPLKTQLNPQTAVGLIAAVVLFSILNSIPVALQADSVTLNEFSYCIESWPNPQLRFAYSIAFFIIIVLLPLSVSGGFYWAIYRRLKQRPSHLSGRKEVEKRKQRTTRLLIITVVCFAICWTPWCFYSLLLEVQTLVNDQNTNKLNLQSVNSNKSIHRQIKTTSTNTTPMDVNTCVDILWLAFGPTLLANNTSNGLMQFNRLHPSVTLIPGRHINFIDLLLKLFAMSSACVNPFLYGWLNEPIRKAMRRQYNRFKLCCNLKPNCHIPTCVTKPDKNGHKLITKLQTFVNLQSYKCGIQTDSNKVGNSNHTNCTTTINDNKNDNHNHKYAQKI